MNEILKVAILDYTPVEIKYRQDVVRNILVSAIKRAVPNGFFVSPDYIRALQEDLPKDNYDMILIGGSPLSTIEYSKDLEVALEQVNRVIRTVPTFGICFGLHVIAKLAGDKPKPINEFEVGLREVVLYEDIAGVGKAGDHLIFPVNHCCKIMNGNNVLKVLAVSNGGIQIADATDYFNGNPVMGVQFHPEFAITDDGWKMFRKIYSKTLEAVLSGKCKEITIKSFLNQLDNKVLKRFKGHMDIDYLIESGRQLTKEQKDLLMSPFYNIDHRKKLLGKVESERNYRKIQQNCILILMSFIKRAIEVKNERKMLISKQECSGSSNEQLLIPKFIEKASEDDKYKMVIRKMQKKTSLRTAKRNNPSKKFDNQMKIPL